VTSIILHERIAVILIYAGCDLGVSSAKVVLVENSHILAFEIIPYRSFPDKAAIAAMEGALKKNGLPEAEVVSCVSTGFGQKAVSFADQTEADVTCLLRGLRELNAKIRTVIDVGGHTLMASNITPDWKLVQPARIEDCAAGTGLFIEMMARVMEIPLEELVSDPFTSVNPICITNTCVVFAESEVISRINDGESRLDIVAGMIKSVAAKIAGITRRIDILPELAMVGGVARYSGVVRELERQFGLQIADLNGVDPRIVKAFGAALGGTKSGMAKL